jgi:hypothetical protein
MLASPISAPSLGPLCKTISDGQSANPADLVPLPRPKISANGILLEQVFPSAAISANLAGSVLQPVAQSMLMLKINFSPFWRSRRFIHRSKANYNFMDTLRG